MPTVSAENTESGLIAGLLSKGYARVHVDSVSGYRSGAIDVASSPKRVIPKDGGGPNGLYCFGIPTEGLSWSTASGVRPYADSVIITEADAIVRDALLGGG
jgi:hypothetical protein